MTRTAQCCCGSLKIKLRGEPEINAVCHCKNCQRRTGSAFGVSLYFPENRLVSVSGKANSYHLDAASGPQTRHFCPNCGTTLYWRSSAFSGLVGVAGGCFDEPVPSPNLSASNNSRAPWVTTPSSWKIMD